MTKPIEPEVVGPALPAVRSSWPLTPVQTAGVIAIPVLTIVGVMFNLGFERVLPDSPWFGGVLIWLACLPFVTAVAWASSRAGVPSLAIVAGVVWVAGGGALYRWAPHASDTTDVTLPDVVMSLSRKKSPGVSLANPSSVVAEQIKWHVLLFNLDDPTTPNDSGGFNAIPMPFELFDFLRAGTGSGLHPLFENKPAGAKVKPGDELFGFSQVTCPKCARHRFYWAFMKFGVSGWYSKVTEGVLAPSALVGPLKELTQKGADRESVLAKIVPLEKRIAFPD